jgi:hypothetical protein
VKKSLGEKAVNSEVTTEIGHRWKDTAKFPMKKERAEAEKQHVADVARYADEHATYLEEHPEASPKKSKTASTGKVNNFVMFGRSMRPSLKEANPDASGKDIMAMLSAQWAELSAEEKAAFAQSPKSAKKSSNATPAKRKKVAPVKVEEVEVEEDEDEDDEDEDEDEEELDE